MENPHHTKFTISGNGWYLHTIIMQGHIRWFNKIQPSLFPQCNFTHPSNIHTPRINQKIPLHYLDRYNWIPNNQALTEVYCHKKRPPSHSTKIYKVEQTNCWPNTCNISRCLINPISKQHLHQWNIQHDIQPERLIQILLWSKCKIPYSINQMKQLYVNNLWLWYRLYFIYAYPKLTIPIHQ